MPETRQLVRKKIIRTPEVVEDGVRVGGQVVEVLEERKEGIVITKKDARDIASLVDSALTTIDIEAGLSARAQLTSEEQSDQKLVEFLHERTQTVFRGALLKERIDNALVKVIGLEHMGKVRATVEIDNSILISVPDAFDPAIVDSFRFTHAELLEA